MKITYATLSSDNQELNEAYDRAVASVRQELGEPVLPVIDGRTSETAETFIEDSPIDTSLTVALVGQSDARHVDAAVTAAKLGSREWAATPWPERDRVLRQAAELISEDGFRLAALLAFETGKTRLEALGEVEEAAEFFRYYGRMMAEHDGFDLELGRLGPSEHNRSVLRPHGVWGVIAPFNYPMALTTGPTAAALLAGNTVVVKPSNRGAAMGRELVRILHAAGVPASAVHLVPGGDETGAALVAHPDLDGITFTGSHEVGMGIHRSLSAERAKPSICEMGGKNPTVVSATADLGLAARGIARSAFGFSGQKCSACSRVYVDRAVSTDLIDALVEETSSLLVGDPLELATFTGPVIDDRALARFDAVTGLAAAEGEVLLGGGRLDAGPLARGRYVQPTIARVPRASNLWRDELFLPFLLIDDVADLDEALVLANGSHLGLTAGFFGEEVDEFLDRIDAGCVYVNRAAGATTGAWPDVQSFGGWKGSGTTGRGGGGPHYLQQYLREQSRTVIG